MKAPLCLVLVFLGYLALCQGVACPFDTGNKCDCTGGTSTSKIFQTVTCKLLSATMNPFNTAVSTYTITGEITISTTNKGPNFTVPAKAFVAFKSIGRLSFVSSTTTKTFLQLQLDENAFLGPIVTGFSVNGFTNIIPFPKAIQTLGWQGLTSLSIQNGNEVYLGDSVFQDFSKLSELVLDNTAITGISDSAFSIFQSSLHTLKLAYAQLSTYPATAICNFKQLQRLDLSFNLMNKFPDSAFSCFGNSLREVKMSGNIFADAAIGNVFDKFPTTVERLIFDSASLSRIPDIVPKLNNLVELNVANNIIRTVTPDQLPPSNNALGVLDLSQNLITQIDDAVFASLSHLRELNLQENNLKSMDLSTLRGEAQLEKVSLDTSQFLLTVTVSAAEMVPAGLKTVSITQSGLTTLDPSLEGLFGKNGFQLLDVSENTGFTCDSKLNWAAKYALCAPIRLKIDGATCKNMANQPLTAYLKQAVSNPCGSSVDRSKRHVLGL